MATVAPTKPEAPAVDMNALMASPEVVAALDAVIARKVEEKLAEAARAAVDKPPMALVSKVHDRFVSETHTGGEPLAWFRLDGQGGVARKILVYDMDEMVGQLGEDGKATGGLLGKVKPAELRRDPNDRKYRSSDFIKRGEWMTIIDGRLPVYDENQLRNIRERAMTLPRDKGGIPGLYEDDGSMIVVCPVANCGKPFPSTDALARHMMHTHGSKQPF